MSIEARALTTTENHQAAADFGDILGSKDMVRLAGGEAPSRKTPVDAFLAGPMAEMRASFKALEASGSVEAKGFIDQVYELAAAGEPAYMYLVSKEA